MLNNVSQTNPEAAFLKKTGVVLASIMLASLLTACGSDGTADTTDTNTNTNTNTNTATKDTDGDGVIDTLDAFPNDKTESVDTDKDGKGNNADTDDDADGVLDTKEVTDGTNPLKADTDGDGFNDKDDAYPLDSTKHVIETPNLTTIYNQVDATGDESATRGRTACIKATTGSTVKYWEQKTTAYTDTQGNHFSADGLDKDHMYWYGSVPDGGAANCGSVLANCTVNEYITYVNSLNLCNINSKTTTGTWRLPTAAELNALVDKETGAAPYIKHIFENTASEDYVGNGVTPSNNTSLLVGSYWSSSDPHDVDPTLAAGSGNRVVVDYGNNVTDGQLKYHATVSGSGYLFPHYVRLIHD